MERKKIKKTLCQIAGSTTGDVCAALNRVVPSIEREHGAIDKNSIEIHQEGKNLVLYAYADAPRSSSEHPPRGQTTTAPPDNPEGQHGFLRPKRLFN